MPYILGAMQDRGMSAVNGMSAAMVTSAVLAGIAVWSGPETRGRDFKRDACDPVMPVGAIELTMVGAIGTNAGRCDWD